MRYFPIFLDLNRRRCLVVGDTEEARRKADTLRTAGATVDCVTTLCPSWHPPAVYALAVVAMGDYRTDADAARILSPLHIPVNVVDRPELCSFVWPAIVDRDPVTIAISTGGTSPTLAMLIRDRIERAIPQAVGKLAALAGRLRRRVRRSLPTVEARRAFWRRTFEGPAGSLAFTGEADAALAALRRQAEIVSQDRDAAVR